jgi:hypothetical protein
MRCAKAAEAMKRMRYWLTALLFAKKVRLHCGLKIRPSDLGVGRDQLSWWSGSV